MENVTKLLAYHITGRWYVQEQLELNKKILVGDKENPFFSFYNNYPKNIFNPKDGKTYPVLDISRRVCGYLESGKFDPDFELLRELFNPIVMIKELNSTIEHYLRYIREVIFEEVRNESYSQLPSRQKGIWAIPIDKNNKSLKYWCEALKSDNMRILKVMLTGKIHRGNQDHLSLTTNNFNFIRDEAKKYWNGTQGNDTEKDELLFEGHATFIEEIRLDSI